jgi:hypothetical protein
MSAIYVVNPRKRRKARKSRARKSTTRRRRRSTPAVAAAPKRRRRASKSRAVCVLSYKLNPRFGVNLVGNVTSALVPSAIAAGGALVADVALGFAFDKLPIPEKFKAGALRHVARGVAAVGVGTLASFLVKPDMARQIMAGGLTVAMHGALRDTLARVAPQVPLADLDEDMGTLERDLGTLIADERAQGALPRGASLAKPMGDLEPESRYV